MFESDSPLGIGQIVHVNKGRDTGVYAVVIHRLDEKFVLIADGERRKFDQPKKKHSTFDFMRLCIPGSSK